jgi:hypothetical protein
VEVLKPELKIGSLNRVFYPEGPTSGCVKMRSKYSQNECCCCLALPGKAQETESGYTCMSGKQ